MAKTYITEKERDFIVAAIKEAELNTSGEIRVHIEGSCAGEVLDQAAFWFEKLKMHKTAQRNGVLFYLAKEDKKFAIIGDAGINEKVPVNFWDATRDAMIEQFKQDEFAEGLRLGILSAGEELKKHFPFQRDDINELSDDISFGK